MYAKADSVKVESDEDGFSLRFSLEYIEGADPDALVVNVQGCAVDLLTAVKQEIGAWLAEGERVRHSLRVTEEDLDGYDRGDPKRAALEEVIDRGGWA